MAPFLDLRPQEVQDIVTINAIHPAYLSRVLLPQILTRPKRSAILITSSGVASFPASGMAAYSASKAFASFLGQALNFELKDKVDVISYEAGETSTKMLKRKPSLTVLTTNRVSKYSLSAIGKDSMTYGPMIHELLMMFVALVPITFIQRMMFKAS
jgi:short-subunit dehydrogenase